MSTTAYHSDIRWFGRYSVALHCLFHPADPFSKTQYNRYNYTKPNLQHDHGIIRLYGCFDEDICLACMPCCFLLAEMAAESEQTGERVVEVGYNDVRHPCQNSDWLPPRTPLAEINLDARKGCRKLRPPAT